VGEGPAGLRVPDRARGQYELFEALRRAHAPAPQAHPDGEGGRCKLLTDIAAEITSRTVLLDWKGVKDDAGKDVPYSQAAAKEYMVKYPDFADMISGFGQQISLYQDKEQEERVKNS
jgi:hypothetical protein